MLDRLCAAVKVFYENPKNLKAYEAWKNQGGKHYGTNNCNAGNDTGES